MAKKTCKRTALVLCFAFLLFGLSTAAAVAMCIQDQYGNQYDFTIDYTNNYLYGTVTMAQGCDATVWYVTGSYYGGGGPPYELTAANPLGDADLFCVTTFKIKGIYPDGEWYYTTGYGAQPFTWLPCGAPAADTSGSGGALK